MLRITKAQDQAMRLSLRLAAAGEQMTLGTLAAQEGLPEPTVAKLLGLLRRGGIVAALRGRNGGYELAVAPEAVSMAAILRAVSSESPPHHHCLDAGPQGEPCPRAEDCGLRSVWRHLQRQVSSILEQTSLADLLQQECEVGDHVDQIWPLASVEVSEEIENGLSSAGITGRLEYR